MSLSKVVGDFTPIPKKARLTRGGGRGLGRLFEGAQSLPDRPLGPQSVAEAARWAPSDVQILTEHGIKYFGVDFGKFLLATMSKGVFMRTDYSGIGGAEEALSKVAAAVADAHGVDLTQKVKVQRAGDLLPRCRRTLVAHTGIGQASCIHSDILDRCPKALLKQLKRLHAKYVRKAHVRIAKGAKKSKTYHELGRQFMKDAGRIAFKCTAKEGASLVAACEVHGRDCAALAPIPASSRCALLLAVAGINGYDWSAMGKGMKSLGSGVFPFLQWARERMMGKESAFVAECVAPFDHVLLGEIFSKHFSLHVLHISPTLFGEPVERQRKYMLLLAKDKLRWHPKVARLGVQVSFERLFSRVLKMKGTDKFRAPDVVVAEHLTAMAAKAGLPERRRNGQVWSSFEVLPQAAQKRLLGHEEALAQMGLPNDYTATANINQNASFMPPALDIVPALLRGSCLWLFPQRRIELGLELMELQGYNIFDESSSSASMDEHVCQFSTFLKTLPNAKLREMAGNAMHLRVMGTVLMFLMACTKRT